MERKVDVRFEEQGNGSYKIMIDESQRGVVIPQEDGAFGYSIFGSPHMGKEESLEDVQKTLERKLD